MNADERRATGTAVAILLLASLLRFGWEVRSAPPLLPPDTTAYAGLMEGTRTALAAEDRRRTPLAAGERIDPNQAPEVELARLPGVGPALAGRIVRSRETEGPFRSVDELVRVQGVGPATMDRLRPFLEVEAAPLHASPSPTPSSPAVASPLVTPSMVASPLSQSPGGTGLAGVGGGVEGGGGHGDRVAVNRASREELQRLPGVGPALAARIEEDRLRNGLYQTPEDLLRVPGIGPATLNRLRDRLQLP
jgi:competence protein ComEA